MSVQLPVLVVEDDPSIARALKRELARHGMLAHVCGSLEQALGYAQGCVFAIIDLNLPDGSGVDVAHQLAARGQLDSVVFFSASTDCQELNRAKQLGTVIAKSEGVARAVEVALHTAPRSSAAPPHSQTRPSTPQAPAVRPRIKSQY